MVNINIAIPDELHKKIKIESVMREISLKEYIIGALEDTIDGKH